MRRRVYAGALAIVVLLTAPGRGAEDYSSPSFLLSFSLEQSPTRIVTDFGLPSRQVRGRGYQVWEYRSDEDGDAEWLFYFELPTRRLLSVARNFPYRAELDALFWNGEARRCEHDDRLVLRRELGSERVLIRVGAQQLMLVRKSAIGRLFPWLSE